MTDVPTVSPASLQELVRRVRPPEKRAKRPRRLAVFGAAPGLERIDTDEGPFELVTVRSELELREKLFGDRREDQEDGRIFLLAWPAAGSLLPLDLRHAFAGERVIRLVGRDRLEQRLGRLVTEDVASTELGQLLDAIPPEKLPGYEASTIDMPGAWRILLAARVGLPILSRPDGPSLVLWTLVGRGGADLGREIRAKPTLSTERDAFLSREFGRLAPVAWRAFEAEKARSFVASGLIVETLLAALRAPEGLSEQDRGAADLLLRQFRSEHGVPEELLPEWGSQTSEALRDLLTGGRRATSPGLASELRAFDAGLLLKEADARTEHLPERLYSQSNLLPRAGTARLGLLARVAREVVTQSSPPADAVERVRDLADLVQAHLRVSAQVKGAALTLARLVVYCVCERRGTLRDAPSDMSARSAASSGAIDSLREWAAYQVQHGGSIDRALRELAATHVEALAPGVAAVRAAITESRARANRSFATRLQAWHKAGAPSDHSLPQLFEVGARVIAPWLEEDASRTLLVLMLDGLSWGVATELLESLAGLGWGPVAEDPTKGLWPTPALAALPSITSVSRTGFFAGQLPAPGTPEPSSELDAARFAAHPALSRFEPKLFVKRTLGTAAALPPEASDTIRERKNRLVGVIVNAVDDWLSGPLQIAHGFSVDTVKPLRALLSACDEAGRSVLVVADHGHTLNDDLAFSGSSAHARWRLPTEPPQEGELAFAGARVWSPPGASSVVLPFVSGATYRGKKVGHHGGATLEEVVAPVILLEHNRCSFPQPHWWRREAGVSAPIAARPAALVQGKAPLFDAPAPAGGLAARLVASEVWEERKKLLPGRFPEDKLYALLDAMERRPRLSGVEFTELTGEPERRMAGFASQAGVALNAGGMEVLSYDREQRRLVLNLELLEQVFEVARG